MFKVMVEVGLRTMPAVWSSRAYSLPLVPDTDTDWNSDKLAKQMTLDMIS